MRKKKQTTAQVAAPGKHWADRMQSAEWRKWAVDYAARCAKRVAETAAKRKREAATDA